MNLKNLSNKITYQILSFLIPFVVYVITLAPSVTFIDSGVLQLKLNQIKSLSNNK